MRYAPVLLYFAIGLQAEPLFEAIQHADTAAVRRLLESGVSADSRDSDGVPALMAATLFGGADCVKLLLEKGANPNAATGTGATALMWAIPDMEKVQLLVARGADVNARSSNLGRTALLIAAGYPGSDDLLSFLIDKGADLRAKDRDGEHALNIAARNADVAVVRFLNESGLDVNEPGANGGVPLTRAIRRQYLPTIEYLLAQGGKIRPSDLMLGSHWLDPKLLERLLKMNPDVNASSASFGRTALISAASSDLAGAATLRLLLDKGADPNQADKDGETALNWAMHRSDRAKVDVLKAFDAKEGTTRRNKIYPKPEGIADARLSLARSTALLQSIGPIVFEKRGCITCHNQSMPAQVAAAARARGIPINEDLATKNLKQILATYRPIADEAMQDKAPPGDELTVGYIAMALAAEKHRPDRITAALTHVVAGRQMPDGSWLEYETRPPLEYSAISKTAMAIRTLTLYQNFRR